MRDEQRVSAEGVPSRFGVIGEEVAAAYAFLDVPGASTCSCIYPL